MSMREREFVDECPVCGTRFIGVSPNAFREDHATDCNPLLALLVFRDQEMTDD